MPEFNYYNPGAYHGLSVRIDIGLWTGSNDLSFISFIWSKVQGCEFVSLWLNHLLWRTTVLVLGGLYFVQELWIVWPLFEGGHYSRVATIRGWPLFEGGHYSRVATI